MFDTKLVGKKIAALRKAKDMTQMELADKMFVSYQAVSNWERGNTMPDISKLMELSQILGVDVQELLGSEKETTIVNKIIDQSEDINLEEVAEVVELMKPSQVEEVVGKAAEEDQQGEGILLRKQGQDEDEGVRVRAAIGEEQHAAEHDRQHEEGEQEEIQRKQPDRLVQVRLVHVLDHGHLELAWQEHHRQHAHEGQRKQRGPAFIDVGRAAADDEGVGESGLLCRAREDVADAAEHAPGDEGADGEKGQQLEQGFEGDRRDHAPLLAHIIRDIIRLKRVIHLNSKTIYVQF